MLIITLNDSYYSSRENREKACLRLKNHAALAKPFATQVIFIFYFLFFFFFISFLFSLKK